MTKRVLLILLFFVTAVSLNAQSNRRLNIKKDSVLYKSYENYEELSFTDSAGILHEGKLFMPNDSEFYFINYFKEKRGKTYKLNDIAEIAVEYYPDGTPKKRKGRYYLSAGAVVVILLFTSYIGAVYLIGREIYLTIKEGPGHSYNPYKHKRIIRLLNPDVTITTNAP